MLVFRKINYYSTIFNKSLIYYIYINKQKSNIGRLIINKSELFSL